MISHMGEQNPLRIFQTIPFEKFWMSVCLNEQYFYFSVEKISTSSDTLQK